MAYFIVGLGNPGEEYDDSRHNTGRMIVDSFHKKISKDYDFSAWKFDQKLSAQKSTGKIGTQSVTLLLPDTFMNNSGKSVKPLITSVKQAHNLVVVHDDIDLPLRVLKIVWNRGTGGHRGVESITKAIKTEEFVRIKIGVSPSTPSGKVKKPQGEEKVVNFILGKFKSTDQEIFKKVSKRAIEALATIVEEGKERAMNLFN
ncbi:MAG: aminoacyl-tRNA hydrolase [Patescibacteria group bacterium]